MSVDMMLLIVFYHLHFTLFLVRFVSPRPSILHDGAESGLQPNR